MTIRRFPFASHVWIAATACAMAVPSCAQSSSSIIPVVKDISIRMAGTAPWHLRLSFTLYDEAGKNPRNGTFEEWWASPGRVHTVLQSPEYSWTEPTEDLQPFNRESFLIGLLVDHTTDPFGAGDLESEDFTHLAPKLNSLSVEKDLEKFGDTPLQCLKSENYAPRSQGFALCSEADTNILRAIQLGPETAVRTRIIIFQGHHVPADLQLLFGNKLIGTAHIEQLEIFDPAKSPLAFSKPEDAADQNQIDGLDPDPPLQRQKAEYPDAARLAGKRGTVSLGATITTKGRLDKAFVISSPDPALSKAALNSLRGWRYKPELEEGEPIEDGALIEVNFR